MLRAVWRMYMGADCLMNIIRVGCMALRAVGLNILKGIGRKERVESSRRVAAVLCGGRNVTVVRRCRSSQRPGGKCRATNERKAQSNHSSLAARPTSSHIVTHHHPQPLPPQPPPEESAEHRNHV